MYSSSLKKSFMLFIITTHTVKSSSFNKGSGKDKPRYATYVVNLRDFALRSVHNDLLFQWIHSMRWHHPYTF